MIHIQEVYRKGEDDVDQLTYAIREKRCIVSFNAKDFDVLNKEYLQENREHWGIIVSKQIPIGLILKRLLKILESHSQEDMKNQLYWL